MFLGNVIITESTCGKYKLAWVWAPGGSPHQDLTTIQHEIALAGGERRGGGHSRNGEWQRKHLEMSADEAKWLRSRIGHSHLSIHSICYSVLSLFLYAAFSKLGAS